MNSEIRDVFSFLPLNFMRSLFQGIAYCLTVSAKKLLNWISEYGVGKKTEEKFNKYIHDLISERVLREKGHTLTTPGYWKMCSDAPAQL